MGWVVPTFSYTLAVCMYQSCMARKRGGRAGHVGPHDVRNSRRTSPKVDFNWVDLLGWSIDKSEQPLKVVIVLFKPDQQTCRIPSVVVH